MMGKIEKVFCYFSIFYLINYLWLEKYIPFLSKLQIVNVICLIFLVALLINLPYLIHREISWKNLGIVSLSVITIFIGFLSSLVFRYQGIAPTLTDFFLFIRFLIIFAAYSILVPDEEKKEMIKFFIPLLKCITIIDFILLLVNIPTHIFPTLDVRYGIAAQQLIYSHPTYLATISFLGWALISKGNNKIYQFMALILMISTMRTKILILIIVYVFYKFFIKKINSAAIKNILVLAAATILGYSSIGSVIYMRLINHETSVRANIMTKALEISKDHFPLGTGFATYGTFMSFVHYSPLYGLYDLSNTYGFLKTSYPYGMDSYISMLLAQFGFLGGGACILLLILMVIGTLSGTNVEQKSYVQLIALFLAMSCFTESIINTGLGLAIFAYLALNNSKNVQISISNYLK